MNSDPNMRKKWAKVPNMRATSVSSYDQPMEQAIYEMEVFQASDRELLNEAYRRGLISRFSTEASAEPYRSKEAPEYMDHVTRFLFDDVSRMAHGKDDLKRFMHIDGLDQLRYAAPYSPPVTLTGEMYICSHPKFVRNEK